MSLDILNLLLTVGGFLLGLIAAYTQIKTFSIRALSSGKEWIKAWAKRHHTETATFAKHPSAFIAFCMRRLVMGFGILFLIPYFSALFKTTGLIPHPTVSSFASLFLPTLCGLLFGSIIARSDEVREYIFESGSNTDV